MKLATGKMRAAMVAGVAGLLASGCDTPVESEPLAFAGAPCERPPVLHCPDTGCEGAIATEGGPVVEPNSGRNYFLDYPCDLKKGEEVTLVLSLHGGGSYGNWQRHYFPLVDNVDANRLVVATPYAPAQFWTPDDDAYLETVVASLIEQIGAKNINSFWLAGHSQGGMTSNRIVCSPFFRDKVDGWLSLSGGRIGPAELAAGFGRGAAPAAPAAPADGEAAAAPPASPAMGRAFPPIEGVNGPETARPGAAVTPTCDINYIFTTGEMEIGPLPERSPWAEKYACGPRERGPDIVDEKAGYVTDSTQQDNPNPAWGRAARPGTAQTHAYPACSGGKLVADVVRLDKGHVEGLEPKVTAELIRMMLSAPGGKLRAAAPE